MVIQLVDEEPVLDFEFFDGRLVSLCVSLEHFKVVLQVLVVTAQRSDLLQAVALLVLDELEPRLQISDLALKRGDLPPITLLVSMRLRRQLVILFRHAIELVLRSAPLPHSNRHIGTHVIILLQLEGHVIL